MFAPKQVGVFILVLHKMSKIFFSSVQISFFLGFPGQKVMVHSKSINSTVPCEVVLPLLAGPCCVQDLGNVAELEAHSDLQPWQLCWSPGSWVIVACTFALGSLSQTSLSSLIAQLQRMDLLIFFA